jgi:hypothetical protein
VLDSLLRLSLTNAKASLEALRGRYDELCARKASLPYGFNLRLPDDLNVATVISQLPSDFFTNPPPMDRSQANSPNKVALSLALLGWQGLSSPKIGAVQNSASCQTCFRRLGLWMFKSKEVSPGGEIIVPAPMDHLNPIKEHRFFCPWKNETFQRLGSAHPNPASDQPGWKILLQTIKNDAYLRGEYEDRPRSVAGPKQKAGAVVPTTPNQTNLTVPGATPTVGLDSPGFNMRPDSGAVEEEDEGARDAKDKERWARLRKVKSLFDTKGGKKLRRTLSRPGTGHSTASGLGS